MPSLGMNAAYAAGTNIAGVTLDPFHAFNFLIEIEGILVGGFSECSGLEVETEYYDYREGGVNEYVHRFIGPTKYQPLVLKHGLTVINGLWTWHQEVTQAIDTGTFKRRNGTVYLLSKQKIPIKWWNFKDAFPCKWTGPQLKADSGDVAFESVELAHRGLS
ncbi:MAG: phage tail protein [Cyanomargarita calcarea GSE-NOS-MK-12-04C]|jgi:phage tail-like protein|uniref:Phage tail protein n=1 Tax=Cyanomargarita calcarea GSE-NOS-MK-12-04C TaxID=2839659 RepID=A0A951USY4_9CYAN|nr:phage tail protein [Cyanomargarita calcarea GSE-NOS-MK-12-04C]